MRRRLRVLILILLVLAVALGAAFLAPAGQIPDVYRCRLAGLEIAYPAYVKSGSVYTMTGLRFAGVALGDRPGVWLADLQATGPLGPDNEPLHCTPASAMTVTGGTWVLRTGSGDIRGQVTGGTIAFRPDMPIIGRCDGPVPASLTISLTSAGGRFSRITTVAMTGTIVDHRLVPATIAADITLR